MAVLVARDGKIVFQGGFGFADLERKTRVTPETKFRIASITKQFTAASILRLAERGKLALNDPLEKFYPGFPRGREITLHHLLNHTSGIANFTRKPEFCGSESRPIAPPELIGKKYPEFSERLSRPIAPADLIAWFRHDPPDFAPGAGARYSNSGYVLLGEIVAQVSGQPLEAFLRETFFVPLGMNDTGLLVNAMPPPGIAIGYRTDTAKPRRTLDWDMSWGRGSGGMYSTVGDLYRWNEALFGGRVVSAESLRQMTTAVWLPPDRGGYGYGLIISDRARLRSIGHGGGVHGWAGDLVRLPEQHSTVVVLANANPPVEGLRPDEVTEEIVGRLFVAEIAKLPPATLWGRLWRRLQTNE